MKGLELARAYYKEYGEPMLREKFPELLPRLAVGLCGSGSECWGFDDVTSRDHDFEPGFCIFLPGEEVVDRKAAFALERAYAALPREFRGFKRSLVSPVGGARHGVIRTSDFLADKVGKPDGQLSLTDWLFIPDYALAEAVKLDGDAAADPYYWQAAKGLHAVLDTVSEQPFSLSEKDLYALLKLVGPFALDMDYEPQDIPIADALGYLSPVISIGASAGGMTFSHQFDTVIARLKVLAPQPAMDDVDIEIEKPEAGDAAVGGHRHVLRALGMAIGGQTESVAADDLA